MELAKEIEERVLRAASELTAALDEAQKLGRYTTRLKTAHTESLDADEAVDHAMRGGAIPSSAFFRTAMRALYEARARHMGLLESGRLKIRH